jgi:predicted deacylase
LRVDFTVPGSREFAKSFNAPVILSSRQRDGSLRQAASHLGIPVLVYEGGEALRYNEVCIRAGVRGTFSAMRYLKMLSANDKPGPQKSRSVISDTSRWVRAPQSGLFVVLENIIGKAVKKGDTLAHIHDPFLINPSIKVTAPFNGLIIGEALKAMATVGDALFHLASFKKISGVKSYIDELRGENG